MTFRVVPLAVPGLPMHGRSTAQRLHICSTDQLSLRDLPDFCRHFPIETGRTAISQGCNIRQTEELAKCASRMWHKFWERDGEKRG